jgi:hypothetical protein
MKTIKIYEETETKTLQSLLKEYEIFLENTDLLIERAKNRNEKCDDLEKMSKDYEIDVSLIRMELTKRLWEETE